jgi:DNA-binding CsgD family transcriptional regulator
MPKHTSLHEVLRFQCCCTLDGRIEPVQVGARGRQPFPLFGREFFDLGVPYDPVADEPSEEFLSELCYGLTPRQRVVFLTRLDSPSSAEAARRLGITRPGVSDHFRRMSKRNVFAQAFRACHRDARPSQHSQY